MDAVNGENQLILSELQNALIEYATTSFVRLLYIQHLSAWLDFHNSTNNANNFEYLTPNELCNIFVTILLPEIFKFQLSDTMKRRLKILDVNRGFQRTPYGYTWNKNHTLKIYKKFKLKPIIDYCHPSDIPKIRKRKAESLLVDPKISRPTHFCHTVLVTTENDGVDGRHNKSRLSKELAALLSAILSTDGELMTAQLMSASEILQRMREDKKRFEDKGRYVYYRIKDDGQSLIKSVKLLTDLRNSFNNFISKKSFRHAQHGVGSAI